jgi:hypothetical protein
MPETPTPDMVRDDMDRRVWAGVIAHLHTPDTHGGVLLPRPQQDIDMAALPLDLTTARLPLDTDRQPYVVGTVERVWRRSNRIYAAGTVDLEHGSAWAHLLLTQGWSPVGPICGKTVPLPSDDNDWWGHDRDPDIDFPPIVAFQEWQLLAVSLCIHAGWPGTFIKLTEHASPFDDPHLAKEETRGNTEG